jgi:hypothetical protein
MDPIVGYRNIASGYTEAIRNTDGKANIGILFVAFMMGPILATYSRFPNYLPLPYVLMPFLVVYFCLLLVLMPRHPKRGRKNFVLSPTAQPGDFAPIIDPVREVEVLKMRCAVLSGILYWKTLLLRTAFFISMTGIVVTLFLLFYAWLH